MELTVLSSMGLWKASCCEEDADSQQSSDHHPIPKAKLIACSNLPNLTGLQFPLSLSGTNRRCSLTASGGHLEYLLGSLFLKNCVLFSEFLNKRERMWQS